MQTMRLSAFKAGPASRSRLVVRNSVAAKPVAIPFKGVDGSDKGSHDLALRVAPESSAKGLVHRYVTLVLQNARQGTASTLTRSEVRGGGKKPYAQKGTGSARRGSNTSPLFPGGGITFGPKPKDWTISMNKKERRLAFATALQSAAPDMIVIESLEGKLAEQKTKAVVELFGKVGVDVMAKKVLLITKEDRKDVHLAGRNISKLKFNTANSISVYDVLNADHIVIEEEAFAHVTSFYGKEVKAEEEATA